MSPFDGVLFFPVTPFTPAGRVAPEVLAQHVRTGLDAGAAGVFAACGTGEFHALEPEEYALVVRAAVETTAGNVPVYAGAGGPLPLARSFARAARAAGADGLLLMPPYLVHSPVGGLVRYVDAVASAADLPVIVYHRGNAVFDPASAVELALLPHVVGFKDGYGDLDLMARIVTAVREALSRQGGDKPFHFFNGLPTAEVSVPAYREIGVELYSSAVFCFAPEISTAYYRAVERGDGELVERFLATFFRPLVALRDKVPGYAVALVKAGVRQQGLDVGGVRPPLLDPTESDLAELARITAAGRELAAQLIDS